MQIQYDQQGTGLSGHERGDFTLDGMVDELEALVEHLQLPPIVLLCSSVAAMVGVAYTARHPERVSGLIFVNPVTTGASLNMPRLVAALTALAELAPHERELAIHVLEHLLASDDAEAPPLPMATYIRDQARPSTALGLWAAYDGSDVGPLLPQLRVPALVLHSRTNRVVHFAAGVQLAAKIPGARFMPIDSDAHVLFGDEGAVLAQRNIVDFLAGDRLSAPEADLSVEPPPGASLSRRQWQVLQLIAIGKSSREIASELVLSERTVQRHIENLYSKIGAHNRAEATAFALQLPNF
jgi:pimeloyl-ACP methyl ester carboxylesterase/DNA-binding CsgD family transcriptional regulator